MINFIASFRWMSWVCHLKLWEERAKRLKRVVVVEEKCELVVVDRGGLEVYTYYIFVLQLQF
jgi:hypothetical protein